LQEHQPSVIFTEYKLKRRKLTMNIAELFEKHNPEYLEFKDVVDKRASRPDLHAFLLLDTLFPTKNDSDIIAASQHDKIHLNIMAGDIEKLTSDQILELTRCGVLYCCEDDALYMFT
jgi:hypothetical protein